MWQEPLAAWAAWLRASGQSSNTVTQRTYQMRRLARSHAGHSPWELTLDDLTAWLASLEIGPNSRRVNRASIRAFYRWAKATGRMDSDPAAALPAIQPPRGLPRPAPEAAIDAALQVADQRQTDAIELGATAGLRRSEIARVHSDDLVRRPDGWWLLVRGKGQHHREVPLTDELGERLASRPAGWIFPNGKGGHLTPAHLGKVMRRPLPGRWTPHTLRHRFASAAYTAERDLMAVKELLGHANVSTTQIYTAVPSGARRAASRAAVISRAAS